MNISKVKSIANLDIGDKVLVKNHVHDTPFEGVIKYIEKNNHSLVISINNGDKIKIFFIFTPQHTFFEYTKSYPRGK